MPSIRPQTAYTNFMNRACFWLLFPNYAEGAKGETMTEHLLHTLIAENGKHYTQPSIDSVRKKIGFPCIDKSGLITDLWNIPHWSEPYIANIDENEPEDYTEIDHINNALWGDMLLIKQRRMGMCLGDKVIEAYSYKKGIIITDKMEWTNARIIRRKELHTQEPETWVETEQGTRYFYGESRGEYYSNCVVLIGQNYYAFDASGYLTKLHPFERLYNMPTLGYISIF